MKIKFVSQGGAFRDVVQEVCRTEVELSGIEVELEYGLEEMKQLQKGSAELRYWIWAILDRVEKAFGGLGKATDMPNGVGESGDLR